MLDELRMNNILDRSIGLSDNWIYRTIGNKAYKFYFYNLILINNYKPQDTLIQITLFQK